MAAGQSHPKSPEAARESRLHCNTNSLLLGNGCNTRTQNVFWRHIVAPRDAFFTRSAHACNTVDSRVRLARLEGGDEKAARAKPRANEYSGIARRSSRRMPAVQQRPPETYYGHNLHDKYSPESNAHNVACSFATLFLRCVPPTSLAWA